jgi:Prolyl oligopeptidase family
MFEQFFTDPSFDFETRSLFGDIHYGAGDVGEMLTAVAKIGDGDAASWVAEWQILAERVQEIGDSSLAKGHRVSARSAYLRAAVYFAAANVFVDGTPNAEAQLTSLFAAHRKCFDLHVGLLEPPAVTLAIPYGDGTMPGYLFTPSDDGAPRPTIILNNGSDAAVTFLWPGLGRPGLDRGYNVVVFDGPGQQSMLFERNIPFRPDWEKVITPLVDLLSERADVDAEKIVLYGTSQGGYWVPRAAAFEHRLAAVVADPGVTNVATKWHEHIPRAMVDLLEEENEAAFTAKMNAAKAQWTPAMLQEIAWRAKPYGSQPSDYATFMAVGAYKLGDVVKNITAPIMITDPEDEQFWPGQSQELFDAVPGSKVIVPFTKAEGANLHIEPMGRSLLEQRMYDWLDETLHGPATV